MSSSQAWVQMIKNLQIEVMDRKGLKVRRDLLDKIRDCVVEVNIWNQSKSLHDITVFITVYNFNLSLIFVSKAESYLRVAF
jgi:hypothetical protein